MLPSFSVQNTPCFGFPRLLLTAILMGGENLVVSFGLVCSTWVSISRGSTMRHYFLPLGDQQAPSVILANLLASRTIDVGDASKLTCSTSRSRTALALQSHCQDRSGHDLDPGQEGHVGDRTTSQQSSFQTPQVSTDFEESYCTLFATMVMLSIESVMNFHIKSEWNGDSLL